MRRLHLTDDSVSIGLPLVADAPISFHVMLYSVGKGEPNQWYLYAKFWLQEVSQRTQFFIIFDAANLSDLLRYIP